MAIEAPSSQNTVSEVRLGLLAALVIFNVVLSTAYQDAMFLPFHDRSRIPPAMLLGSLITAATSVLLNRFLKRASPPASLRLILVGLTLLTVGAGLWNWRPDKTSTFILFLFVELATTLGAVATWTYFQAPLDPSQIRRLMPRLGAWAGGGGLLAGAVIPLVLKKLETPNVLVFLSALAWLAASTLVSSTHAVPEARKARRRSKVQTNLLGVLRLPLARWMILGVAGVTWMGLLLQYETRVAMRQLEPSTIAQAMGVLLALTSIVGIVVQGALTAPILERWGVGLALAILPTLVALFLGLYFELRYVWVIAGAYFVDKTLRPNLHRPAESCLLAALTPAVRPVMLMALGSIMAPLLKASGSLALWGLASFVDPTWILVAALLITAGMLLLSMLWGKLYERTLRETLSDGTVDMLGDGETYMPLIDGPRLDILLESIDMGSPRSRELALELLRPHRSNMVRRAMLSRIKHPFEEVRIAALRWLSDEPSKDLFALLKERFADPKLSPEERIAILAAAGGQAPGLMGADLSRWLEAPDTALRAAVIRALYASPDATHQTLAMQSTHRLLESEAPRERVAGLMLVEEWRDRLFLTEVLRRTQDRDVAVRRAALTCLPLLDIEAAAQPIWSALSDPVLAHVAVRALASAGERVIPDIVEAIRDAGTTPQVRLHLVRALGLIPSQLSVPCLLDCLATGDRPLQLDVIKSLNQLRRHSQWKLDEEQKRRLSTFILSDLRWGLRIRWSYKILTLRRHMSSLVIRELEAQIEATQQRVTRVLALLSSRETMARIYSALRSPTSPYRDQARELLKTQLDSRPLQTGCLQLLDESLPWSEECFKPPLDVFPERSPDAALAWLKSTGDLWILCALKHDPNYPPVPNLPEIIEDPMEPSLDTILFLKDVALFEALTNQQLVEVARLAEKTEFPAGVALFKQGDPADYLYLVRQGKLSVKVHGQEVAKLGAGECAGEMAVLSGTERTATVETVEPSHLLRFESEDFLTLLETYPEIGRALLKSLVRRLVQAGGPRKGARPATMTGMVWGREGPSSNYKPR